MNITDTLSARFLAATARLGSFRRQRWKDRGIVYESSGSGKVYVIETGYVRLISPQPDGRHAVRAIMGRGALFGDIPFRPTIYKSEELAITSGTSSLLELDRAALEAAACHDQELRQLLLEIYGAQWEFLDRRLQWQLVLPLQRRIAMTLVDLMCFGGQFCPHGKGYLMHIRMTHEELSELVVAARPTVSAILKTFHNQGLISYTRAHLCVRDLHALRGIAASVSSL